MKGIARLILVINICFVIVFLLALSVSLFQLRVEILQTKPILFGVSAEELINAIHIAFPFTIYTAILLGLSYTARRNFPNLPSIIIVMIIGICYSFLISIGIKTLSNTLDESHSSKRIVLGSAGLIFSNSDRITVFLEDPSNEQSPQVVATSNQPLEYKRTTTFQNSSETAKSFKVMSAIINENSILYTIRRDLDFLVIQFRNRLMENFIPFIVYMISMVFLLSSLRFIMDISVWPLASLFLGILAFRGILSLDVWIESRSSQIFLILFLGDYLPSWLITPLIFYVIGMVFLILTIISAIKRKRRFDERENF